MKNDNTPDTVIREEGNRLISNFDGWQSNKYSHLPNRLHKVENGREIGISVDDLTYHKNWNLLMPVCKKLDTLTEGGKIEWSNEAAFFNDRMDNAVIKHYEIQPVWEAVIDFIQWYNTINNKTEVK